MKGHTVFKNLRRNKQVGTFPIIDLTVPQAPKPEGTIDILGAYLQSPRQNRVAILGETASPVLKPSFLNP